MLSLCGLQYYLIIAVKSFAQNQGANYGPALLIKAWGVFKVAYVLL